MLSLLLSDDELRAPGEALCYVKEALADMALSSIRGGGRCNVVTLQREKTLQQTGPFLSLSCLLNAFPSPSVV